MIGAWTKHLTTEEEKEQFKNTIRSSKPVLRRLDELLDEEINKLDRLESNVEVYNLPNWDYRQAHVNGARQSLRAIKTLLTLDPQEKQ